MKAFKTIKKYGEKGILIEWEQQIDPSISRSLVIAKKNLQEKYQEQLVDISNGYASLLLLFYKDTTLELLEGVQRFLNGITIPLEKETANIIEIPVCYDFEFGKDLKAFLKAKKLTLVQFINLHTKKVYPVYCKGFLPGFLYLGGLDKQLHFPRKKTPSLRVPKNSVAIGGAQTGIYPCESPGGWHIVGRTPLTLFATTSNTIPKIKVGDGIKFKAISKKEFDLMKASQSEGLVTKKSVTKACSFIKVLHPGIACSIQDLGRFGYLSQGIPIAGSMDKESAGLANLLVGNSEKEAVLEWKLQPPKLQFSITTLIAIVATDAIVYVDTVAMATHKAIRVFANSVVEIKLKSPTAYGYLAVKGGVQTSEVLGSRSFYAAVTSSPFLVKGMKLPITTIQTTIEVTSLSKLKPIRVDTALSLLSVTPGPEFELLPKELQRQFTNRLFSVCNQSNRMGALLNESIEEHSHTILSSPVIPGTIQWTPSGKLIVLMRDAQTIGGYPRIFQLTEASISILAKVAAGNFVQFSLKESK